MKPEILNLTGKNIQEVRKRRRLSQTDLGKLIDLSRSWISQIENEKKLRSLTVGNVQKLGEVLNVEWRIAPPKKT